LNGTIEQLPLVNINPEIKKVDKQDNKQKIEEQGDKNKAVGGAQNGDAADEPSQSPESDDADPSS